MSVKPETVGLSSQKLEHASELIANRYVESGHLPCSVLLVHRRGETAHFSVHGQRDVARAKPVEKDTIFRIYSMTKPMTSVALMMLYEEGAFQLDDPVHRYIPEWRGLGVFDGGIIGSFQKRPTQRPMLMIDLLRHTSGLTYGFQMRTNVDAAYRNLRVADYIDQISLDDMIARLAELPLEFSPGDCWNYSVSTDVCGYIIGKLTGLPFEQYLRQQLIDPLGMADTGFYVPSSEWGRLASCYAAAPDGSMIVADDAETSLFKEPPVFVSGGGGLVSTAQDYLQFCKMLANNGQLDGRRYLSRKTIDLMTSNHLPGEKSLTDMSVSLFSEATLAGMGFGLGFAVTHNPATAMISGSPGEYFWGGAASTAFWIDPAEQLIVIFLTQLQPSTTYNIRRELRTLIYSAIVD